MLNSYLENDLLGSIQAAKMDGLTARDAFDLLQSKTLNSLMEKGYTISVAEIK